MSTLVIKFGGNVIGTASGVHEILNVINSQRPIWDNLVVITSALTGVTDALHDVVRIAETGDQHGVRDSIADIRDLHVEVANFAISNPERRAALLQELDILIFDLLDDCNIIRQRRQASPELADRIVAMGERLITRLIAAAGRAQNIRCVDVDASLLLVTDDRYSNARPIFNLSEQHIEKNLKPLLSNKIVPIVTGYIGATQQGAFTTLGRGGSDYSATYLAALLKADEVWFFSDVSGLMTADPVEVPAAKVLPNSSYTEVAEMAHFGARVLHPRSVEPLRQAGIPLRIRSIEQLNAPGTYISAQHTLREHRLQAVTQVDGVMITGESQSNMAEACSRLLSQALHDEIEPTLQIENNRQTTLTFIAPTSANQQSFQKCIDQLRGNQINEGWEVQEVVVVAVIGNLRLTHHIAILNALASADITPLAFGNSNQHIFLITVLPPDATTTLQQIHKLIVRH